MRPTLPLLFLPLLLAASPATQSFTPAPRPPDKILTLPNVTEIRSIHQGHEGSQVYVELTTSRLNVSRALAAFWPEFLTLTLLLILFRLRRRLTRRVGTDEHCRTCGYQLTGLPSNICPECGTTLTPENRQLGRPGPVSRHVSWYLAAGLVIAYFLLRPHYPRELALPHALSFYSSPLARFVKDHPKLQASKFIESHDEIALIDVETPHRLKTIRWFPRDFDRGPIRYISPDHSTIYYETDNGHHQSELSRMDVGTGRVRTAPEDQEQVYVADEWATSDGVKWITIVFGRKLIVRSFDSGKPISEVELELPKSATRRFRFCRIILLPKSIAYVMALENPRNKFESMLFCEWNPEDGRLIRSSNLNPHMIWQGHASYGGGWISIRDFEFNFSTFDLFDIDSGQVLASFDNSKIGTLTPDGNWFVSIPNSSGTLLQLHRLPPKSTSRPATTNPAQN